MTTRPRLAEFDRGAVAGLAAVVLFGLMVAVFLTAQFGQPDGFAADVSIVKGIGFAMFDIDAGIASEGFLAAFEIIDIVLVAALVGAEMLARRDEGGSVLKAVTDGGIRPGSDDGDSEDDTADPAADADTSEGGER